nr:hypothetical protein [Vibrio anguillarum]
MNIISRLHNPIIFKYLFAGVINTIFGYSLFSFLIFINIDHKISITISTIIGVVFNYFNFGRNVFKIESNQFTFYRFFFVYILSYLINLVFITLLVDCLKYNPYLSQGVCIFSLILINW